MWIWQASLVLDRREDALKLFEEARVVVHKTRECRLDAAEKGILPSGGPCRRGYRKVSRANLSCP